MINEKQYKICNALVNNINFWISSSNINDIGHYLDIEDSKEILMEENIDEDITEKLVIHLTHLLNFIKEIK